MTGFPWRRLTEWGPTCQGCKVYSAEFAITLPQDTQVPSRLYFCKACMQRLRVTTKAVQREIQATTVKKVRPE